jgi:drug/metabolite transporter (DMT)-like permease
VGDFIGGMATRRLGALRVLLVSQTPTLVLIALLAIVQGRRLQPGGWMVAGVLGGLVGLVGLAALYRGMAIGVVSIVAAIAATAPIVPLVAGLILGERPSALQLTGMAVALAGVLFLTVERRPSGGNQRLLPGVGLALVAALAFGGFLLAMRYASRPDPLLGVLAVRVGSVGALLALAAIRRPGLRLGPPDFGILFAVGILDVGADVLFAVATTIGLLSVVSVLSSLYPVVTVLLARLVLDERLKRAQGLGILLAFAGVLLISL